jgi:hypothetical protein
VISTQNVCKILVTNRTSIGCFDLSVVNSNDILVQGATTLSITTLALMTFSITTLGLITLSLTTLGLMTFSKICYIVTFRGTFFTV